MTDSLHGILIGGMLGGNLIAGHFGLGWSIVVETVTPTPTITVTPTPTIYPTPTPLPPLISTGGGGGVVFDTFKTPLEKNIRITLKIKGKQYVTYHKKDDRIVKIVINMIRVFNSVKESVQGIAIRKVPTETQTNKIKVKKHDS